MKISLLLLGLTLSTLPVRAQTTAQSVAALPSARQMATVTPFITGLKEPQGMASNKYGNILICEYGAGAVARFSRVGKPMGYLWKNDSGSRALKNPAQIIAFAEIPWLKPKEQPLDFVMWVTDPTGNRVFTLEKEFGGGGGLYSDNTNIAEPMGILDGPRGLMLASHATSQVYRWQEPLPTSNKLPPRGELSRQIQPKPTRISQKGDWRPFFAPATAATRYGFRSLASDGEAYFLSDDIGHQIVKLTEDGQISRFANDISIPSGIVVGPDKMVYVANEGDGGQLIRLNSEGEKTVVAEKLGRPNSILFLDAKTALVSNRDGNVWKVVLP